MTMQLTDNALTILKVRYGPMMGVRRLQTEVSQSS